MYELAIIGLPPLVFLGALAGQLWWGVAPGAPVDRRRATGGPLDARALAAWQRDGVWRSPPGATTLVAQHRPRPPHQRLAHETLPGLAHGQPRRLAAALEHDDDAWLLGLWAADEAATGFALRPEGLTRVRAASGRLRVDVVRLPRAERPGEAMFVGLVRAGAGFRVFALEQPPRGELLLLTEATPSLERVEYGPVEALDPDEFADAIGAALAGDLDPAEPVGVGEGSGRVVFD